MSATEVATGADVNLTAFIEGGVPPYRFGIAFGEAQPVTYDRQPQNGGWILTHFAAPAVSEGTSVTATVGVIDRNGDIASATATLKVEPH